jgi:L-seryl-tRNA(Ser) seleniumtransferase
VSLRDLPAVEHLLQSDQGRALIDRHGRALTIQAVRHVLDAARHEITQGAPAPSMDALLEQARTTIALWLTPTLHPLINATGIIIHTNLGRAPLCESARQAVLTLSGEYCSLEYDVGPGKRGRRNSHIEHLLTRLTGAEAGMVVGNNAGAVLLALSGLARRKDVLISRTQLIEIGGGFRIPEVLKQSGAKLVEVGTTNRTHLRDYESAIHERTGLILRAHHSNFRIIGFTTEPTLEELVALGSRHGVPVVDDLGSGALLDTGAFGLGHEPTVQESLQAGAALVTFSGDKLLGGPQAGIILGNKALVERLKRHPLARALRPDKLCLAALAATLIHYLEGNATQAIPVWRMIAVPAEDLHQRARHWARMLKQGEVIASRSAVGGGSLPEETLPTWVLALQHGKPNTLAARLRQGHPPIIARVEQDQVLLDPRTVLPEQDDALLSVLRKALS